ncbi:Hypothetical protein FKW44_008755, partial [Caligus rogercresseyi]
MEDVDSRPKCILLFENECRRYFHVGPLNIIHNFRCLYNYALNADVKGSDYSMDIIKAKEFLNIEELPAELAAIMANFSELAAAERLPLRESLRIVEK